MVRKKKKEPEQQGNEELFRSEEHTSELQSHLT